MRHVPSESEEDTKQRYITPALMRAGWTSLQMMMEYSLKSDRFRIVPQKNVTEKIKPTGRNKPDYLLCVKQNVPIAVVEAKRSGMRAEDGIDQAVTYARLLDIPFAYASAGEKFIERNLRTGTQREFSMENFPEPAKLWRMWCEARNVPLKERGLLHDAGYYTTDDGKVPRYYQMVAINKTVNAVIADHRKRLLLVMATGTGKTFTAFQIVWRLRHAGVVKNVLYLADRNQLIDQTLTGDFIPFEKIQTKITQGKIDQNYEIYFGLYQQLKSPGGEEGEAISLADRYKQVPKDYFDLVIVDECHRGSAREESSWRTILDYFSPAIQIGLTATPNKKDGADNIDYFGEPIYTYTLKQGIEDGYLAPFQVLSVKLDADVTGWEPEPGERDLDGKLIPHRKYTLDDFDRTLILKQRTKAVAQVVTDALHRLGRMSKTIVFCTTQRHAADLRDALRACNEDMMALHPDYIVRMTGDDEEGRALYGDFISTLEPYPVVVTTSKLLSTGADTKCVKLIVLDSPIRSMTEFKQIIGRGTRLREDAGKTFFTIIDFRNACELFKDPEFDGEASVTNIDDWKKADPEDESSNDHESPTEEKKKRPEINPPIAPGDDLPEHYVVEGRPVAVFGTKVEGLDENGKLVTFKFMDYTRKNILKALGSKANFIELWNGPEEKKRILEDLKNQGVFIEHLRKEMGNPDLDEFDLICSVAFGATPMTRQARASRLARSKFLDRYQGVARSVLERLLTIYAHEGVCEIDDKMAVLRSQEFQDLGGLPNMIKSFGGKPAYLKAVNDLEKELYVSAD
jgi:type I restriction enzyme R subunit